MQLHSYPKVFALGHKAVDGILDGNIIIQEKIDGSQFSFGIIGGKLFCRSKGKNQDLTCPDALFIKAVETISKLDLKEGLTYRGEYLSKPKHNTLTYERIPNNYIIIFDINDGLESYWPYERVKKEVERIGLEVVPKIYEGKGEDFSFKKFEELLSIKSILGNVPVEGVVIKNYNKFGADGKVLMGKFVSEKFKEANSSTHKPKTGKDIIALIIEKYKTEARWNKSVQHLNENGVLLGEPKDIGNLIKEVGIDLFDECEEEIKNWLFNYFKKEILNGVTRGLPEWYKQKLTNKMFNKTEEDNLKL